MSLAGPNKHFRHPKREAACIQDRKNISPAMDSKAPVCGFDEKESMTDLSAQGIANPAASVSNKAMMPIVI